MDLLQRFIHHLKGLSYLDKNDRHIVAVSGGLDSIVLCNLLLKAGFDFVIAHCNFRLRGDESNRDEQFVIETAKRLNKPFKVAHFNTEAYATQHKLSIQVAARSLRYEWFKQLRTELLANNYLPHTEYNKEANATQTRGSLKRDSINNTPKDCYIITAHHADDNIETVVMNFFRGTGIQGLKGMDDVNGKIVRPLLPFRRKEILQYANDNKLNFVEDSSNASNDYTRNYFRNELLPAVEKVFPNTEENLIRNIERFKDAEILYNAAVHSIKQKLIQYKGEEEYIPVLKLQKQPALKTIIWEIIKSKSFTTGQIGEVVKLMQSDNNGFIESATHRIIRNRKWLVIVPKAEQIQSSIIVINHNDNIVQFPAGELEFKYNTIYNGQILSTDRNCATIDASLLQYPIILRKWKTGDYFYPLGMPKKKKVSRFLIDQKLCLLEKENVWVLVSDKKIVWIINYRIDDRFKVTDQTKRNCKIIFK